MASADHFDMMTDAPLANGDGLNYMNKRTSVGIGVNTLRFDCKPCEMHVVGAMKPAILRSPPPFAVPYSPLTFHRRSRV